MKKCIWMLCFGVVFSSFALAAEEKNKAVQPAKPSLTVVWSSRNKRLWWSRF